MPSSPIHRQASHCSSAVSPWLLRWAHVLPPAAHMLDLACGTGRHAHWLLTQGHTVTAVDRDEAALATLRAASGVHSSRLACIGADLEANAWPLPARQFDGVLVTNYLWRPLWPSLLNAVAPGGWLIYETFGAGQAHIGRPARPEFLLQPGELLTAVGGWHVLAYEDGFESALSRYVQRIVARRPSAEDGVPLRFALADGTAEAPNSRS